MCAWHATRSLRALYGTDGTQNATHGSDAAHTARREIKFFYPEFLSLPITDSAGCKKYIAEQLQPTLIKGLTVLAKVRTPAAATPAPRPPSLTARAHPARHRACACRARVA